MTVQEFYDFAKEIGATDYTMVGFTRDFKKFGYLIGPIPFKNENLMILHIDVPFPDLDEENYDG